MMDPRFTTEPDGRVRDRLLSPSINFPQSEEEAFQAILRDVRDKVTNSRTPLNRVFTGDAGLGMTRSEESARWLNEAQDLIRARIEDLLDTLDLENRVTTAPLPPEPGA